MTDGSSEPVNFIKFCPHCGSQRFEARSAREFLCGACGFNFFINSATAVVAIIRDSSGRILLTRRDRDPWAGHLDLPGGFVDPGESAEQALRREVREELNIEIRSARYIASAPNEYVFSNFKVRTTDLAFECQVDTIPTTASDDVRQLVWTLPQDIDINLFPFPSIRQLTETYLKLLRCEKP